MDNIVCTIERRWSYGDKSYYYIQLCVNQRTGKFTEEFLYWDEADYSEE